MGVSGVIGSRLELDIDNNIINIDGGRSRHMVVLLCQ